MYFGISIPAFADFSDPLPVDGAHRSIPLRLEL
jgi:hypothetical protein